MMINNSNIKNAGMSDVTLITAITKDTQHFFIPSNTFVTEGMNV